MKYQTESTTRKNGADRSNGVRPANVHNDCRTDPPCQDILRMASAIGFSHKELLEIRRLYQPLAKDRMK